MPPMPNREVELEERVCRAEVARDNMCAQLDENKNKLKSVRTLNGRRISLLLDIIREQCGADTYSDALKKIQEVK